MTDSSAATPDGVDPEEFRSHPVDPESARRLHESGLDLRLVRPDDEAFAAWSQVVARGFLDGERTDEQIAAVRDRSGYRRITGAYDASAPMADAPVATIASWIGRLTVPGGGDIPSCAISAVTVAPTHRRRGVARALLEGELRLAKAAGAPMAMLTVSESTLYGRYGFASAAASGELRVETKRARWTGPVPAGRVDFVPRARAREVIAELHERVRPRRPGEIDVPAGMWDSITGMRPDAEKPGDRRAVQYADAGGEVRGLALYSVKENHDDFTKSTVTVTYLVAETDDAYAALWRFLLGLDLVGEVNAHVQSVDEPLLWMVDDRRAIRVTVTDHQYLRILDLAAALEARTYQTPGRFLLDVSDPLDLAGGRYLLSIDDTLRATVTPVRDGEAAPDDAVDIALGIPELSAAYLGGVSLATLAAAGRVRSTDAARAARAFGWHTAPQLSIWY